MSQLGDFCCSPLGDFIASALHARGCDADCVSNIDCSSSYVDVVVSGVSSTFTRYWYRDYGRTNLCTGTRLSYYETCSFGCSNGSHRLLNMPSAEMTVRPYNPSYADITLLCCWGVLKRFTAGCSFQRVGSPPPDAGWMDDGLPVTDYLVALGLWVRTNGNWVWCVHSGGLNGQIQVPCGVVPSSIQPVQGVPICGGQRVPSTAFPGYYYNSYEVYSGTPGDVSLSAHLVGS